MENILFGTDISFLGEGMFDGCISLKSVSLPKRLVDISTGLFNGCSSLETVVFPPGLKTIGESAFRDCGGLEEVIIGKEVSYIGGSPFRGCRRLRKIRVNDRNKYFRSTESDGKKGQVLYNKNRSELICFPAGIDEKIYNIPDSVTTICEWAFSYSQLEHVEISDSVDIIKENAFFKCRNLKEIRLPDGVTVLDDMAFRKCEALRSVFIPASVSRIGYAVFFRVRKGTGYL